MLLLVGLVCSLGVLAAHAQIELPPEAFEDVMERARAKGTPIVVEIFAPWCPYCARMQKTVYGDSTVQDYLSQHFVHARLNSSTSAGTHRYRNRLFSSAELASAFGTRGVPNTVFLEADGTPIARQPGFLDRSTFLKLIRYVGSGAYEEQGFDAFREQQSD